MVLALDVLEGRAETLILEGNEDIVDAALEASSGEALAATQAKTKTEPYVWTPQELADVISTWLDTGPSPDVRFDFVTDGSLGPAVVAKLVPALRGVAEGTSSEADREYLRSLDLDPNDPALRQVALHSRLPDGRTLLERATLRVMALRERAGRVSVEEGRDLVWRLFGETVLGSAETEATRRRLNRQKIAGIVGVPIALIDEADPWSRSLEERYRTALSSVDPDPAWTLLGLLQADRPAVLSLVMPQADTGDVRVPQDAMSLLDRDDSILLQGPAGAGKTTTLAQMRAESLNQQLLPIQLSVGSYVPGSLERLLRRALEIAVERPLVSGVVGQLLDRSDVIVFLDGAGELVPEQRLAVIEDLARLRDAHGEARFVLAARDPAPFGRSNLTGFILQPLDHEGRLEIAAALADHGADLVEEIEGRLGDLAENPLLFTMALGLRARGVEVDTRAELFEAFTSGLQAREEGTVLSVSARAAVEAASFDLRAEDQYSADRWWWLERLTAFRSELIARGTISIDGPAADQLLAELEAVGLLRPTGDGADLGLLHDLFCDWLASEAVRHGARQLPDPVTDALEEATVFLAEAGALDSEQLLAVAGNPVVAARCADVLPAEDIEVSLADRLWQRLRDELADSVRAPLERRHLQVQSGSPQWLTLGAETRPTTPDDAALRSPISCLAQEPVSSLSAAVDLWLAVVRLALRERHAETPVRPARDDEDLARLVEAHATAVDAEVDQLVGSIAPGLLPRVRRTIGASGMRAWLLPADEFPGMPGTDDTVTEHLLHYVTASEGAHVELVADARAVPADAQVRTSAESYLRERPRAAAVKRVRDALAALIPRLDA